MCSQAYRVVSPYLLWIRDFGSAGYTTERIHGCHWRRFWLPAGKRGLVVPERGSHPLLSPVLVGATTRLSPVPVVSNALHLSRVNPECVRDGRRLEARTQSG